MLHRLKKRSSGATHKEVARAHWEQLKTKVRSPEEMLARLEVCNFYRFTKNAPNDYTLFWFPRFQKISLRIFLEEYFSAMGVKAEIKENLTKLRVTIKTVNTKTLRLYFTKNLLHPKFN